jgi:hypothetical protein
MRIRLRYGAAVGILAALFSMLGPVSAQASQIPGTSVPTTSHHPGIANRTVQPTPNQRVILYGLQVACDHGDLNSGNPHGLQYGYPPPMVWNLSPSQAVGSPQVYSWNYNNAGFFDMQYTFTPYLAGNLALVKIDTKMTDDNGIGNPTNNVLTSGTQWVMVPADGNTYPFNSTIQNSGFGYHNGPCNLTGTATNTGT